MTEHFFLVLPPNSKYYAEYYYKSSTNAQLTSSSYFIGYAISAHKTHPNYENTHASSAIFRFPLLTSQTRRDVTHKKLNEIKAQQNFLPIHWKCSPDPVLGIDRLVVHTPSIFGVKALIWLQLKTFFYFIE